MQTKTVLGLALAAAAIGAFATASTRVIAADHVDAPEASADPAADITDFYAWTTTERLTAVVAFAGLAEAGTDAVYDAGVLYGIHVDNDGDGESDHDIWARFGQNAAGEWGLMVTGLGDEDLVGAVEEPLSAGDTRAWAGLRDDPFFFDLEGYSMTLESGDLSFDSTRDFFAGLNVTAIVVETDPRMLAGEDGTFTMWATTRRAQ